MDRLPCISALMRITLYDYYTLYFTQIFNFLSKLFQI